MAVIDLRAKPFYLSDEEIAWVETTRESMSTDDKIRQLFCMIAYDNDPESIRHMARDVRPCGVMYRPFSADDAIAITNALQSNSKIPMLIAANLERGGNGIVTEGTQFGNPMQVAATDDVSFATRLGTVCGREGAAVGANWSFAPIIDIDYNFRNPITNLRTFGSDPERVKAFGEAYVRAVQKEGVAASIKHFPGDGRDERDQHLVTSINDMSCEDWDATYGAAYKASIEAGALTVMIGHIMQPAYSRRLVPGIKDADIMPATLAPELIGGLLREKLGFNGLVVSDATSMAGFCIPMHRKDAVPKAIAAGCDVFLFTKNMEEDIAYMQQGYESGIITEARLDEAITRILALKAALKLHTRNLTLDPAEQKRKIGTPEHIGWANACADKSVTLVKNIGGILPVSPRTHRRVQLISLLSGPSYFSYAGAGEDTENAFIKLLEAEGFEVTRFTPPQGMEGRTIRYSDVADSYDLILYLANLATKSNQTTVRIEWAQPMGANCPNYIAAVPTVFVSLANPYHLIDVPRVPALVNAYTATPEVMRAAIDKLLGRSAFEGTSPVDAFCGMWDTHL